MPKDPYPHSHTIETIDLVNHSSTYGDEKIVKFYHPADIFMTGKIPNCKEDAFVVGRQFDTLESAIGIFYPTTKKRLYDSSGNFVITVVPVPCLAMIHEEDQPLYGGFDDWHGTGTGPHNRPTVCFSVRLLNKPFKSEMNKTQCAGKAKKTTDGIYFWEEDCNQPAIQSQYFHISGQIQRRIAVCNSCIGVGEGFGSLFPRLIG